MDFETCKALVVAENKGHPIGKMYQSSAKYVGLSSIYLPLLEIHPLHPSSLTTLRLDVGTTLEEPIYCTFLSPIPKSGHRSSTFRLNNTDTKEH